MTLEEMYFNVNQFVGETSHEQMLISWPYYTLDRYKAIQCSNIRWKQIIKICILKSGVAAGL